MKKLAIVVALMANAAVAASPEDVEATKEQLNQEVMFHGVGGLYSDVRVEVVKNTYQLHTHILADYLVDEDHDRYAKSKCTLISDYLRQRVQRVFPAGYVEVIMSTPDEKVVHTHVCDE